jgi:hypothetical protein
MSSGGVLIGALKGEWGVDSTGNRVFVGKWIDRAGRFQGFVKGTWRMNEVAFSPWPVGIFEGKIFNAERRPIGFLGGHYWMMGARPGGYFAGRWCVGGGCFSNRP